MLEEKKPIEDLEVRIETGRMGDSKFENPGFCKVVSDSQQRTYKCCEDKCYSGCTCASCYD